MLPACSYGCGYVDLVEVIAGVHKLGESREAVSRSQSLSPVLGLQSVFCVHDLLASRALRPGMYSALWTSTGLDNATWEVGTAGSRGIKVGTGQDAETWI